MVDKLGKQTPGELRFLVSSSALIVSANHIKHSGGGGPCGGGARVNSFIYRLLPPPVYGPPLSGQSPASPVNISVGMRPLPGASLTPTCKSVTGEPRAKF